MSAALAVLATSPDDALAVAADPGQFVVLACERAKQWLVEAVEHGDIDRLVETKSQAEAIRIYTAQKQLGKDAELAAAEIVRRAERGIAICIRRGQDEGTIRRRGERAAQSAVSGLSGKPGPGDYLSHDELHGSGERAGVYAMCDGASDEQFEAAIDEAKAERNLSRANVVRKIRGEQAPAPSGRNEMLRGYRHADPNRIVDQAVIHYVPLPLSTFELLEGRYSELDRDRLENWASSLTDAIRSLTTLRNNLRKELAQ